AVGGAGLAAGFLRIGLGRPLGEGGGLALAGAALLLEQLGHAVELGFQFGDAALQRLAAGTSAFVHAAMIVKRHAGSCARRGNQASGGAKQLPCLLAGWTHSECKTHNSRTPTVACSRPSCDRSTN